MQLHKLAKQDYLCKNLLIMFHIAKKNTAVERFVLWKAKKEFNKLHKLRKAATQVPAR